MESDRKVGECDFNIFFEFSHRQGCIRLFDAGVKNLTRGHQI